MQISAGVFRVTGVVCLLIGFVVGGLFVNPLFSAENTNKELVANGGAEQNSGWVSYCCGTDALPKLNEQTSADTHTGGYSRHIIFSIIAGQSYPMVSSPAFVSETSKTYQVRFWYKIIKGTFRVQMRNGANTEYVTFTAGEFSPKHGSQNELVWTEFIGSYTEKNGGPSASIRFFGGSEAEFYLDDVSVKENSGQ